MLVVREYIEADHLNGVKACLVELQDFERAFNPRMPTGEEIVEFYLPAMMLRCTQCDGAVLVAELDNEVAGYITVLSKVRSEDLEDGDYEYGLIFDLIVLSEYRQQGVGKKLLQAGEAYARAKEVKWLKVGVLADNNIANDLYESAGFKSLYVEREKVL
jgi:ribosomal protein S18 acetylase RimI-like enzyme